MFFDPPITYRLEDGSTKTVSELSLVLIDNAKSRSVTALLFPSHKALPIWSGAEYDAAGDYTQEQAEARVREVLGDDPSEVLSAPLPPHLENPSLPEPSQNPY